MSKKFNPDDYNGKYAMHCETEEEAKDFCRVLHEAGRKWNSLVGKSYLNFTHYETYKSDTCYYFNEGKYSDIDFVRRDTDGPYTILEWSDFMNKGFTMDDLKNFDIVLMRSGDVRILIGSQFIDKNGCMMGPSSNYFDDLTYPFDSERDIFAVRRPSTMEELSFDAFKKNLGHIVYERDETVEMTLEEVCRLLGKNVKIVKEVKS